MEKSGAHRRLALGMVHAVGGKGGRRLVLGFMLACGFISLWISNIAALLMVLPIALAVLEQAEDRNELTAPLLLGMSYASSIAGIGTPIGTPTNLIFMAAYKQTTGNDVSFLDWMKIGMPVVIFLVPLAWLSLTRKFGPAKKIEIPYPGPWRSEEKRVLIVFALTALAWIFRKEPFGGWTGLIGRPGIDDSTVALLSVTAMFLIPNGHGGRLLDWKTASNIPWGLMLLVAGGITLAKAFDSSGLSEIIGQKLSGLSHFPLLIMMVALTFGVMLMTEVTTNMATTALLMPLLAAAGTGAGLDPALLMLPAAISASCAFMLPCGTFPNAVICGTGRVSIGIMAREGLLVKFIAVAVVTAVCYLTLVK
jgi:sodium-dependent dicarboxylate transporter 2/3/5